MQCSACGHDLVVFAVPEQYRDHVPGSESTVGLCPRCLALDPVPDADDPAPDFGRVSDSFPDDSEAAVPMALLVGLLSNLALYRSEISTLLEAVERAGTDPLLVLDRLSYDESIETDIDLGGRRTQLEQLL
jgi:hypothetical protein